MQSTAEVKAWLRRGNIAQRRIDELMADKRHEESYVTSITRPLTKRIARLTPGRGDAGIINYLDKTADMDIEIREHQKIINEIMYAVSRINCYISRMILIDKYIRDFNLYEIAERSERSDRQISRLHAAALGELLIVLNKLYPNKSEVA